MTFIMAWWVVSIDRCWVRLIWGRYDSLVPVVASLELLDQ